MSSGSDKIWPAISRVTAAAKSVADMVRDVYGAGPQGGPNYGAAGADLGRSVSTLRTWNREGVPAGSDAAPKLTDTHTKWAAGPGGRTAAMNPRREARLRNTGSSLIITGTFQVSDGETARGSRTVSVKLSGEQMSSILDALIDGDESRAHRLLEEAVGDKGFGTTPDINIGAMRTSQ